MRIAAAALLLPILLPAQGGEGGGAARGAKAEAKAAPAPLDRAETEAIVRAYATADSWALRALVLLSLGRDWHPAGASILVAALREKGGKLAPYAVETLHRTGDRVLPSVAEKELVGELIAALDAKSARLQARVLELLPRLAPSAGATDRAQWKAWWKSAQERFAAPPAWTAPPSPEDAGEKKHRTVATIVERAFDLRDAGLDVVFVLDTTGSMQPVIDAARDAITDVSGLLAGISPRLRLGLVHYRDFGDFGEGAQLLVPLTKDHAQLAKRLGNLVAGGGGDIPERVEKGIETALGKETGWKPETNRMLLVIGDAPPHVETETELLAAVKRAYEAPETVFAEMRGKKGAATTGKPKPAEPLRPFVTSAIATSEQAKRSFSEIAEAGGGAFAMLEQEKRVEGKRIGEGKSAPRQVAEHVLLLAFGKRHEAGVKAFAEIFFEYQRDEK